MKRARKQRGAFTLMEAVVALAVFTVGMLGLGGAFSQIVRANAAAQRKQTAALLAERKLAELRTAPAGTLTQTSGTFAPPVDGYTWEVRFGSHSQDLRLMDVWVEVTHRAGTAVRLWSQMVAPDDQ